MEEISKKNTKKNPQILSKICKSCLYYMWRFLIVRRKLLFANLTTKNRALSRTKDSSKEA